MHRRELLQKLISYRSKYVQEVATCDRFIEFVENHVNCFSRGLETGHVTGSAWLVDECGEKVVLTHHKKLNIWIQLGGHADGESDVLQVALQEAVEESGIDNIRIVSPELFDIDIHTIPRFKNTPAHAHFDARFVFRATGQNALKLSDESHELAWIPINEMAKYNSEESMLRMARKWMDWKNSAIGI
ncbi:MAG: NUDIX domain-containing protein [Calditrichaeota bacterium]|nr:MAG: NUDIX domain-containing protein [Calditrichota bacterium]